MSSEKTKTIDTDSNPLLDHLHEEIPIEDIRDADSPQRLGSIDFVKGFAIVFIIICHAGGAWLDNDWVFMYGQIYAVLDILGPSLFIFLSALSVVFSIKRKKGRLPDPVIRNRIFTRGAVIMAIGLLYNFIGVEAGVGTYEFPLNPAPILVSIKSLISSKTPNSFLFAFSILSAGLSTICSIASKNMIFFTSS